MHKTDIFSGIGRVILITGMISHFDAGKLVQISFKILKFRHQSVRIGQRLPESQRVTHGVPQG